MVKYNNRKVKQNLKVQAACDLCKFNSWNVGHLVGFIEKSIARQNYENRLLHQWIMCNLLFWESSHES